MILEHKRAAAISAVISCLSYVILIATLPLDRFDENAWAMISFCIFLYSMLASTWWYAKAKGYPGALGMLCFLFNVPGLILLALIPDKCPLSDNAENSN